MSSHSTLMSCLIFLTPPMSSLRRCGRIFQDPGARPAPAAYDIAVGRKSLQPHRSQQVERRWRPPWRRQHGQPLPAPTCFGSSSALSHRPCQPGEDGEAVFRRRRKDELSTDCGRWHAQPDEGCRHGKRHEQGPYESDEKPAQPPPCEAGPRRRQRRGQVRSHRRRLYLDMSRRCVKSIMRLARCECSIKRRRVVLVQVASTSLTSS